MKRPIEPVNKREAVAVFRAEIIGSLTRKDLPRGALKRELEKLAEESFRPPGSDLTKSYGVSTLERWMYTYRKGGLKALEPKIRKDRGHGRGLNREQKKLLLAIRRLHPSVPASVIRDTLIAEGQLDPKKASLSQIQRFYCQNGLSRQPRSKGSQGGQRLRWEAAHPSALWHGDVCHGPKIVIDGKPCPLRIHALLDDASRYVLALEAHHTEREEDMLEVLIGAIRRHGLIDAIYLDNGSTYRGETLSVVCARLGIGLLHAKPYDPQARGKMERFWRVLRERCLDYVGHLSSLHDVQVRLYAFLDQYYQRHPHAGLIGRTPESVWTAWWRGQPDRNRRADETKLRQALTVRSRRLVKSDSTLKHEGIEWEVDQGFLAKKRVVVAHCPLDRPIQPWVEYQDATYKLQPVNPQENAKRGRKKPKEVADDPVKPTFDPAGALLKRITTRIKKENS